MQNIDLKVLQKKKFTINGDENTILELNPSDMNVLVRLQENYPHITDFIAEFKDIEIKEDNTEEDIAQAAEKLKFIDSKMRTTIDTIFDTNVCEVCCPTLSLFTLIGGKFAYEYIIDAISALYEDELQKEFKKVEARIKKHTDKYTKEK